MVTREVSLYLKYPASKDTLQRVQNSSLECVIEFKTGKEAVLLTTAPKELKSEYRIKGSVCLVEDELIVQFKPKNTGLYTVRIFSDTRELCRPVAFLIDHNCDAEGTSYYHPVKPTASYVRRSPALSTTSAEQQPRCSAFEDVKLRRTTDPQSASGGQASEQQSPESLGQPRPPSLSPFSEVQQVHPEAFNTEHQLVKGFTSDPFLAGSPDPHTSLAQAAHYQDIQSGEGIIWTSDHAVQGMAQRSGNMQGNRLSYISAMGSRPPSTADDSAQFSGDLFSTLPDRKSFNHLYAEKQTGSPSYYGSRRNILDFSHNAVITPETFKTMAAMGRRKKAKKRCGICTKKLKSSKLVQMGEDDFCEACFRRQYLIRSAIEHFMIPTIEECTVEVPVNKKSTKFITTRKTIPNVNLRGLEPSEVKYAQGEFKKFDMEGNGWISKALLFPLMKACFYYTLQDKEIKALLSSQALQSVIKSYGLNERDEVHEIEFLSLLAFVARERQRLKTSTNPRTKFTPSDLEMAYAFRQQFQGAAQAQRSRPVGGQLLSPQYTSPTHSMPPPFRGASQSDYRMSSNMQLGLAQRMQPQIIAGHPAYISQVVRSPTESSVQSHSLHPPINLNASMVASPQVPTFSPTSIRRPTSNLNPLQFSPYHAMSPARGAGMERGHTPSIQQAQVGVSQPHSPSRREAQVQRTAVGPQTARHNLSSNQPDTTGFELPEEDREDAVEAELPHLPPDKDPQAQTLTKPQPRKKGQNKEMMQELKLTGGVSDGWMLY